MCATLIGGMDRLKQEYVRAAKQAGVDLKIFTGKENSIAAQLGKSERIIIFTNKVSHQARNEALNVAKSKNIPVQMVHSCGVSSLRKALAKASELA
jgi:ABC-type sugar transport system substrate-binding protein